jgi:energy-coupling factor transport system ATP-binding protein
VAYAADRCGLLFDGNVLSVAEPHTFMGNNSFYTASANRMCRDIIKGVITAEEIVSVLKKNAK